MTWKSNTAEQPTKPGYYLTYYWNEEQKNYFFKAFSYGGGKWNYRFDPKVIAWWDKHFDFYVPCQTQPDVDPLPEAYLVNVTITDAK